MKKNRIISKKNIVFLIFIFSIYFLRVLNLDQDLPPWGIGYYQPVDEGAYSLLALNYTHYGSLNPLTIEGTQYEISTPLQARTNIFGNILSIISLKLLGNNYYGFRFGYVFLGCGNLFLYILILEKMKQENSSCDYKNKLFIAFTFLLLFDFMFFMCSRVVENSSARLFFNLLIVYIWLSKKENYKSRFLIISFLSVCSVFFVYITNIFSMLAIFLCIVSIFIHKNRRSALIATCYSFIGGTIALALAELYYRIIWKSNIIEAFWGIIKSFSASDGYTITNVSTNILSVGFQKFLAYWASNNLLYNVPIAFFILALFPIIFKIAVFKNDENITLIVFFLLSFLLQTIFVEDCIGRKIISIYPLFLILVYYLMINWQKILNIITQWGKKCSIVYTCYLLFILMLCALIIYYRLYKAADRTNFDIDTATRWTILFGCHLVELLFIFLFAIISHAKLSISAFTYIGERLVYIIITGLLLINISLIYRFCFKNISFYERDAMRELNDYVSQQDIFVTGGGYQLSYSLYNQMQFLLADELSDIKMWMADNEKVYIIDYEFDEAGIQHYFNNYLFNGNGYTVEPIYVIKRNFMAYGEIRNFCLYKIKYIEPPNN